MSHLFIYRFISCPSNNTFQGGLHNFQAKITWKLLAAKFSLRELMLNLGLAKAWWLFCLRVYEFVAYTTCNWFKQRNTNGGVSTFCCRSKLSTYHLLQWAQTLEQYLPNFILQRRSVGSVAEDMLCTWMSPVQSLESPGGAVRDFPPHPTPIWKPWKLRVLTES